MTEAGSFTVPADHPSLPGHFPGNPVAPGVMLLDRALSAVLARHPGQRAALLPQVKFLRPVRPGDAVTVDAAAPQEGRVAFACRVEGETVLRGAVVLESYS